MKRLIALLVACAFASMLVLVGFGGGAATRVNAAGAGKLGIDDELTDVQERLLSGFASFELSKSGADNGQPTQHPDTYFPRGSQDCSNNISSNIKVNQNCLNLSDPDLQGRGQAQNEEFIKVDPNNPNHIVASENDYRRGDGTCGTQYSLDNGRTWNESTVPNNFVRGATVNGRAREYFQAGGDTSVDWDSKGNVYLSCQMFKRGLGTSGDRDQANGLYVFRSTQNDGASWNFPGRPVVETPPGSSTGQTTFLPLEDKQFIAVDHSGTKCAGATTATPGAACSPFQDRVYVTWTEFAPNGSAFIYESYSADYGEHFSARHLVSLTSPLCPNDYGLGTASSCNENQFSQPFVGPDGVLYVIYSNFNNAETTGTTQDNRNQILLSKSLDGGNTFGPPIKVSDYYDLPDCATYQQGHDFGRACVPEKNATANSIFRATNYGSGEVNPTNPAQVVVTFGSYINRHSNEANGCIPTGFDPSTGQDLYTGVKTPGACNNDILVSVSNNGGNTFTGTTTDPRVLQSVTNDAGQATTDQWWQWIAFTKNGKLATSYYDRQYGNDEAIGYQDFSLSAGSDPYAKFNVYRITNSPMPFPTQFPEGGTSAGGTFWGDYTGLTADTQAHPFWSDTRSPDLFACPGAGGAGTFASPPAVCTAQDNGTPLNDQDAYTASQGVSSAP
jgi:hypothetical protein